MVGLGTFKIPEGCKLLDYSDGRKTFQPYWRCSHNCLYCYAKNGYRWTYWGSRSETMISVDLDQARRDYIGLKSGTQIEASSSCDPFDLKFEKKYGVTKKFLKNIVPLRSDIPITWVTKSEIISDYVDLLPELSIPQITIDSFGKKCKELSPGASIFDKRCETIKILSEAGFDVGLRIDPIIPGYDKMEELNKIIQINSEYLDHITISVVKFPSKKLINRLNRLGALKVNLRKIGREYWYPAKIRKNYHKYIRNKCNELGITFASCRESLVNETGFCDPFHLLNGK